MTDMPIFDKELDSLLSKPISYYRKLIIKNNPKFDFNKPVVLFGAGSLGLVFLQLCKNTKIKVEKVCDNDSSKKGKKILGIRIISINELIKFPKETQIIITIMHDFIVKQQLKKLGFKNIFSHTYFATIYPRKFKYFNWQSSLAPLKKNYKEVIKAYSLLADNKSKKVFRQLIKHRLTLNCNKLNGVIDDVEKVYFDREIINLSKNEVFIDGGAFNGDTLISFLKNVDNKFYEYHAFEPDKKNFNDLKSFVEKKGFKNVFVYNEGLGLIDKLVKFNSDGLMSARVTETGDDIINIKALDSYLDKIKPTFIKLDIEGSERDALLGMKKSINLCKPKLAVSVYHKPDDLWRLLILLHRLNNDYKLYLRHYTKTFHETVCYVV